MDWNTAAPLPADSCVNWAGFTEQELDEVALPWLEQGELEDGGDRKPHRATERKRRQAIATLINSLRKLVPGDERRTKVAVLVDVGKELTVLQSRQKQMADEMERLRAAAADAEARAAAAMADHGRLADKMAGLEAENSKLRKIATAFVMEAAANGIGNLQIKRTPTGATSIVRESPRGGQEPPSPLRPVEFEGVSPHGTDALLGEGFSPRKRKWEDDGPGAYGPERALVDSEKGGMRRVVSCPQNMMLTAPKPQPLLMMGGDDDDQSDSSSFSASKRQRAGSVEYGSFETSDPVSSFLLDSDAMLRDVADDAHRVLEEQRFRQERIREMDHGTRSPSYDRQRSPPFPPPPVSIPGLERPLRGQPFGFGGGTPVAGSVHTPMSLSPALALATSLSSTFPAPNPFGRTGGDVHASQPEPLRRATVEEPRRPGYRPTPAGGPAAAPPPPPRAHVSLLPPVPGMHRWEMQQFRKGDTPPSSLPPTPHASHHHHQHQHQHTPDHANVPPYVVSFRTFASAASLDGTTPAMEEALGFLSEDVTPVTMCQ